MQHFEYNYKKGARVHSDSWGGPLYTYDQDCADVDTFLWSHLDFVSVLAAGNDGLWVCVDVSTTITTMCKFTHCAHTHQHFSPPHTTGLSSTQAISTIGSPASAKNAIAVGATLSLGSDGRQGPAAGLLMYSGTLRAVGVAEPVRVVGSGLVGGPLLDTLRDG